MNRKGFTMIELMVVVIILGILVAAAVPIYRANTRRAYSAEALATLGSIREAERLYFSESNLYQPVDAGTAAGDDGIRGVLGLDTRSNQYFDNPCFAVTASGTGDTAAFTATATGNAANSLAPSRAKVGDISITMDEKGTVTGP